jgi:hypothetical protein
LAFAWIQVSSSFVAVTGVSITGSSTVQAGAFLPLTAAVEPENASNKSVSWSSDDPAVATVNEATGLVKGIAQGTAVITATTAEGQKTAQITITVTPAAQKSFRFDMSGAKAIYAVDTSDTGSRNARAADGQSADVLLKAMSDDTVVPLADFSTVKEAMGDNLPLVSFMVHSPVEGSKDIYISFERDLFYREIVETREDWSDGFEWVSNGNSGYYVKYETTVIGSFIHIKEDGSYTTIIKSESGNYWENNGIFKNSDDEPVLFDAAGNLYYMRSISNGTVIYRYNRGSGTVTPVTPAAGNSYTKVAISADGAYIYAQGNRWGDTSASFLRIIPTANPDITQNIYYSSGGSSSIYSFTLNPQTKELYISGSNIKPGGSTVTYNGFFKGKIQSTNPNHWEWTPLVNANYENFCYPYSSSGPIIVESSKSIDSYTDEDGVWHDSDTEYTYAWNQRYRKDNGTVDYAAIMDLFYQAAVSDNIEFRYGGKTDREALASLDDAKLEELYKRYSYDHTTGQTINDGDVQFAHDYLFRIDTGKPVVLSHSSYSFSYVTNTVFTGDGSIWGFIRDSSWYSQKYCKLIDAGGKRDFVVPESLASGRKIISIKPADPFVYYMADVNPDGSESGYQRIYRFRMDNPHTADDMFRYIYSRNPDRIEILSYAAGGDYLYFSGTQGTYILNAKIDVNSGIYTELDFGFKVSSVLAY